MRWTPEKIVQLKMLAGVPIALLAEALGTTAHSVANQAFKLGLSLEIGCGSPEPDAVRARVAVLLPGMKAALRADVSRIMLDKLQDVAE